jgi:hypothetical protein
LSSVNSRLKRALTACRRDVALDLVQIMAHIRPTHAEVCFRPISRHSSILERFRAKHALVLDTWVGTGSREESASNQKSEHDPEKHAFGLDPMGGHRFSEKIMFNQ